MIFHILQIGHKATAVIAETLTIGALITDAVRFPWLTQLQPDLRFRARPRL
jgi:hypothetical protein